MNASIPLLWTTSASSTVLYQSTIAWNCLVASTACANFAGTTRRFPLRSPADSAGIAVPPARGVFDRLCTTESLHSYCNDRVAETMGRACRFTGDKTQPAGACPPWERTGWLEDSFSVAANLSSPVG